MKLEDLEPIVRASAALLDEQEFVIVGSAAILVLAHDYSLPAMATRSDEVDVVPPNDADGTKATIIDAVLGELSLFHDANAYSPRAWARTRLGCLPAGEIAPSLSRRHPSSYRGTASR